MTHGLLCAGGVFMALFLIFGVRPATESVPHDFPQVTSAKHASHLLVKHA